AVKAEREIAGARVLLLGAGGAGRAIAVALADAGASRIGIVDIDTQRAGALVATINAAGTSCVAGIVAPQAAGHDIIVNATPVGMRQGDALPAEIGPLDPGTTVIDI